MKGSIMGNNHSSHLCEVSNREVISLFFFLNTTLSLRSKCYLKKAIWKTEIPALNNLWNLYSFLLDAGPLAMNRGTEALKSLLGGRCILKLYLQD